jgi:hypothetical protein
MRHAIHMEAVCAVEGVEGLTKGKSYGILGFMADVTGPDEDIFFVRNDDRKVHIRYGRQAFEDLPLDPPDDGFILCSDGGLADERRKTKELVLEILNLIDWCGAGWREDGPGVDPNPVKVGETWIVRSISPDGDVVRGPCVATMEKNGWRAWIGPDLRLAAFREEVDGRQPTLERLVVFEPPEDGMVLACAEKTGPGRRRRKS